MSDPLPSNRADAIAVLTRMRDAGHVAYFAGGCVRDLLLGEPPKDYDVATDAPPEKVRNIFPRSQAVGAAFGVVLVSQGRSKIEVATFRTDGKYLDGRRPAEVVFTTAEEDARRRDFTINGLFYDPLTEQVLDYIGGQADLKAGVIRAIGNPTERFAEDHLRLLRAVRFAARLGFTIEPGTAEAIRAHATHLTRISPERVGQELRLMLPPATRAAAWGMLLNLQLAPVIFRFSKASAGRLRPAIIARLPADKIPFGLALAAITLEWLYNGELAPLLERKPIQHLVQSLRQSLKFSNEESAELAGTLEGVGILLHARPPGTARLKRFLARPTAALSRQLWAALQPLLPADHFAAIVERLAELEKTEFAPAPLLTGDQLTSAGYAPGPVFKRLLDAVYDAQLEGRIHTSEEAMALARSLMM